MSVPWLSNVLTGWTKPVLVTITSSTIDENGKRVEIENVPQFMQMNIQPMTTPELNRKPEAQRVWNWFSLIMKSDVLLSVQDIVTIGEKKYRIQKITDWRGNGFSKYDVVEDYDS